MPKDGSLGCLPILSVSNPAPWRFLHVSFALIFPQHGWSLSNSFYSSIWILCSVCDQAGSHLASSSLICDAGAGAELARPGSGRQKALHNQRPDRQASAAVLTLLPLNSSQSGATTTATLEQLQSPFSLPSTASFSPLPHPTSLLLLIMGATFWLIIASFKTMDCLYLKLCAPAGYMTWPDSLLSPSCSM